MTVPREDLRVAAGRRVIFGFHGMELDAELRELLREVRPAGVILFARNVETPAQVAELIRQIKHATGQPTLVTADQEGGRVARIRAPATQWPAMGQLGRLRQPRLTQRVARCLGAELRAMGLDLTLAPVLDVHTNPNNPVIGDRAFSHDPTEVAAQATAFLAGLSEAGVGACGKHFPGHGDTDLDSHHALPVVRQGLARLREVEWAPFRAAIGAGLDAVMSAHVVVECLDPDHPATLSSAALEPLRGELDFGGVLLSDDLEMAAVRERYRAEEMVTRGQAAGIDVFLPCSDPAFVLEVYRALVVGAELQHIDHARMMSAAGRSESWVRRHARPAATTADRTLSVVGCSEHAELAADLAARIAAKAPDLPDP